MARLSVSLAALVALTQAQAGPSHVLLAGDVTTTCYVLYDAQGKALRRSPFPPYSLALPPSSEAEASKARGERLVILPDSDCDRATRAEQLHPQGAILPEETKPNPVPMAASGAAAPPIQPIRPNPNTRVTRGNKPL